MTPDKSPRGFLITMLVGAGCLVLAQLVGWPPVTGFERAVTGSTVAAVVIAVSPTAYEWRQSRQAPRNDGPDI